MEEKKRYELDITGGILDTQDKIQIFLNDSEIVDLLNHQDKRIKELELLLNQENQQLKQSLKQQVREEVVEEIRERLKKANFEIMSPIDLYSYTDNFLYQVEKGKGLCTTKVQKQLAISKLEDVYQVVKDYNSEANKYEPYIDTLDIEQYIDDKIKELKGEL